MHKLINSRSLGPAVPGNRYATGDKLDAGPCRLFVGQGLITTLSLRFTIKCSS